MGTEKRQSNIECLRIIAMVMVLVLHANCLANGYPSHEDLVENGFFSAFRILLQMFTLVSVDLFVMISGWFGINCTRKNIGNILFQCLFSSLVAFVICFFISPETISVKKILTQIFVGSGWWFVPAYLGLMVLSPVLNAFVNNSNRLECKSVIISFFLFEIAYGWFYVDVANFRYGFSLLSFIGIYLLMRFVRVHKPQWSLFSMRKDFFLYLLFTLLTFVAVMAISFWGSDSTIDMLRHKFTAFNSPFMILAAMFLFLSFSKKKMAYSKFISFCAKSSFAIYLMHCNPLIFGKYLTLMKYLFESYDGWLCLCVFVVVIFFISFACILLDKIRLLLWNYFSKKTLSKFT